MDSDAQASWSLPIGWAIATAVLIAITLIFDPEWAYYASWVAGGMVGISLSRTIKARERSRRLDLEDQVLALQVRLAKAEREIAELRADLQYGQKLPGTAEHAHDEKA
jgi:hypothetical protein